MKSSDLLPGIHPIMDALCLRLCQLDPQARINVLAYRERREGNRLVLNLTSPLSSPVTPTPDADRPPLTLLLSMPASTPPPFDDALRQIGRKRKRGGEVSARDHWKL